MKVDRNSLQEAENTIAALKEETSSYRDRVGILMKILYGLIAFCVVLLFIVINLVLKKKDMKAELNDYRSLGYPAENTAEYSNGQGYEVRRTIHRGMTVRNLQARISALRNLKDRIWVPRSL